MMSFRVVEVLKGIANLNLSAKIPFSTSTRGILLNYYKYYMKLKTYYLVQYPFSWSFIFTGAEKTMHE